MMPCPQYARNSTMAIIRYIKDQKSTFERRVDAAPGMGVVVKGYTSKVEREMISLAKKTACTGFPPPQMMEKQRPTPMKPSSVLLKEAMSLIRVQSE